MLTLEQRIERRKGLGASEAPIVAGVSPYASPLDLYREKRGEAKAEEEERLHLPFEIGQALEPVTLRFFEHKRGVAVGHRQVRVVDPKNSWRWVTLDGAINDREIVEAKSSGLYFMWGEEEDDIPEPIIYQAQHGMACTGADICWVPVILRGQQFEVYKIRRDQEFIDMLTAVEHHFFHEHVLKQQPPDAKTLADLKSKFPRDTRGDIRATEAIVKLALHHSQLKADMKFLEKQCEQVDFQLKSFLGEYSTLVDAKGKPLATWKAHDTTRVDLETLRARHPQIAADCSTTSPVRALLNKTKSKPSAYLLPKETPDEQS